MYQLCLKIIDTNWTTLFYHIDCNKTIVSHWKQLPGKKHTYGDVVPIDWRSAGRSTTVDAFRWFMSVFSMISALSKWHLWSWLLIFWNQLIIWIKRLGYQGYALLVLNTCSQKVRCDRERYRHEACKRQNPHFCLEPVLRARSKSCVKMSFKYFITNCYYHKKRSDSSSVLAVLSCPESGSSPTVSRLSKSAICHLKLESESSP